MKPSLSMPEQPRAARITPRNLFFLFILALLGPLAFPPAASALPASEMYWYLDSMQAEKMWRSSQGQGVTIAVIDTGVDRNVPELRGQVLDGKSFHGSGSPYKDLDSHGTTMAALISGTGESGGIQGLAPKSKILPLKTTDEFGLPGDMAAAIDYAVKHGAKIINISLDAPDVAENKRLQRAVDRAHREGVLIFASTGNKGTDEPSYPAALPGVIAVAATDKQAKRSKSSQYGSHVSLSAPGVDMAVRCENNTNICTSSGTSAATAIASASAALIWSKQPDWTANQVLRVLIETAGKPTEGKVPSKYIGYGAVRPRIALADDSIDPGDPNKSPLFSKYYAKQDEKNGSSKPSDGNEATGAPDHQSPKGSEPTATQEDSNGATLVFVAAGVVAAVGAAAAGFLLKRRRGSK